MSQSTNVSSGMESDPMGSMFSQMFDRMQLKGQANAIAASEAVTIRAEEEKQGLNHQIAELRSENSTLSSRNQELQSTNQQLLSANQTLRKQLSELNETSRLLEETKRRERACTEREERCDLILSREAMLESGEIRLRNDRAKFENERQEMRESIAEQVNIETDRERRRLEEDNDKQWERGGRVLFVLCVGACSFAIPMLAIAMQNRWRDFMATLPEWFETRKQPFKGFRCVAY